MQICWFKSSFFLADQRCFPNISPLVIHEAEKWLYCEADGLQGWIPRCYVENTENLSDWQNVSLSNREIMPLWCARILFLLFMFLLLFFRRMNTSHNMQLSVSLRFFSIFWNHCLYEQQINFFNAGAIYVTFHFH